MQIEILRYVVDEQRLVVNDTMTSRCQIDMSARRLLTFGSLHGALVAGAVKCQLGFPDIGHSWPPRRSTGVAV